MNVYGDMVRQIGGSHVSVTSILSDPNADPHLYEPGTQNGLAVAKARLVIQNGLGYDAFMQRLEDASPSSQRLVVTVADVLGVHGKDANPHLWYDVPRLGTIAGAIASGLEQSDPAHAAAYRAGLRRFRDEPRPAEARGGADQDVVRAASRSRTRSPFPATSSPRPVSTTSRRTPSRARSRTAPSRRRRRVSAMNALMSGHRIKVLLYNSQAVSPITKQIRERGRQGGDPRDRRDRDAAAEPHVPAVAARAGTRALRGAEDVTAPVVSVRRLALHFGERSLWNDLDFELQEGELLAVLGPNGTGKTSLLRILLGLLEPSAGTVEVCGRPPRESRTKVGYVPQQRVFDRDLPLRGRDLVRLGLDGHRWGVGRVSHDERARIDRALTEVGAAAYADAPVGRLSGGEQQRLRVAQALVSDPALLLADEPLLSLDLSYQRIITSLFDARRRSAGTPVVFVTHDINPVLSIVDRVLYLAPGSWAIGTPEEVLTSETLTRLYDTEIDVLRVRGRIVVVGTPDDQHVHHIDEVHA